MKAKPTHCDLEDATVQPKPKKSGGDPHMITPEEWQRFMDLDHCLKSLRTALSDSGRRQRSLEKAIQQIRKELEKLANDFAARQEAGRNGRRLRSHAHTPRGERGKP